MATTVRTPPMRHTRGWPHLQRGRHGRAGPRIVAIGIVICLALVVAGLAITDNLPGVSGDDASERTPVQSYYVPGQGDGLLNDANLAVAAPAQPDQTSRYEQYVAEGWRVPGFDPGAIPSPQEQARLAYSEMLFREWNDLPGWLAPPERPAVTLWEDALFLEQNGVYQDESTTTVQGTDESLLPYECSVAMDPANCLEYLPGPLVPN